MCSTSRAPDFTVVTLLWRNQAHAAPFAASLDVAAERAARDVEVVAVVNGPEGTEAMAALQRAASDRPRLRVRYLELPENLGFAGGANHGCDTVGCEVTVLANLDLTFDPAFVLELARATRTMRHPSFLAPSVTPSSGGAPPRELGALRRGRFHELQTVAGTARAGDRVPAGNGCCIVFDRCLYETRTRANGSLFDPEYESYYEDLDLFWWADRSGIEVLFRPELRVAHVQGGSFAGKYRFVDRSSDVRRSVMANYRITVWKNASRPDDVLRWLVGELGYVVRSVQAGGVLGVAAYVSSWGVAVRRVSCIRRRRGHVRARTTAGARAEAGR